MIVSFTRELPYVALSARWRLPDGVEGSYDDDVLLFRASRCQAVD